jgi:cell shape-determining protein MreC
MTSEWIVAGAAAGSLVIGVATLVLCVLVLGSVRRSKRTSEERLEILREQQERLEDLHEEHRLLWEQLGVESPKESPEASESVMQEPERARAPRLATGSPQEGTQKPWWRRVFGGVAKPDGGD